MATTVSVPPLTDYNGWARFWYSIIGANVIPAKTRIKKTFVKWTPYQDEPVPRETFEEWIRNDEFKDGMALVLGRVWRGEYEGKYLIFIDLDNLKAVDEFCTMNDGQTYNLKQIAGQYIVEQHKDDENKAHILFYSDIPFTKKDSDANSIDDFDTRFRNNEVPALEIKGLGGHGIVYCTPSIHKNGHHYEIIGVQIPEVLSKEAAEQIMRHIDDICKKYGLHYRENKTDIYGKNVAQLPMADLYNLDLVTREGNNRHLRLLRLMESLIFKLRDKMSLDQIKQLAKIYNETVFDVPKSEKEFEEDWKDAQKFVADRDAEKAAMQSQEELLDGCTAMELINRSPETYAAVIKKDNYHNPTTKMIHPIRAIQEVEIKREKDKDGNSKPAESRYKHFILNAIPVPPIEVIYDPLFERTKYRIKWEYVGPGNVIKGGGDNDEPVGPFTKEELKDYLVEQTNWVYKRKLLDDTLDQVIKGYCSRKRMARFTTEIETEGLVWLSKENRLALSKWDRYKPTPEEAMECIKVLFELQEKFYQYTAKRPFERKRFAHFIKVGLVSVIDFARRQCGAVESHGFIPRQDLGGWSNSGKTTGYAGLVLRPYRLPLYGKTKYVIGAGSVETEARLIHHTKGTTMPVILDDADFFTDWNRNDQAKRCLSIMKYATENTNPRNILTQDSKGLDLPLCAFTMLTHNSDLVDEDGFIRRSTGHEFTKDDEKTLQEVKEYQAYFDDQHHSHVFGYLGDFAINYYLEHPQILFNDWLTIAKTVLKEFFVYAGLTSAEETHRWLLDEVVDSSTSQTKLAENRSAGIAAALHDIIQNHGWVRNKREAAIWIAKNSRRKINAPSLDFNNGVATEAIDDVMATATLEEKIKALTAINALPFIRWHDEHEVCLTAPVVEELKKHGITRVSHTQLPSYCEGFEYDRLRFGDRQQRVVYAKLDKFIEFINPSNNQQ